MEVALVYFAIMNEGKVFCFVTDELDHLSDHR